MLTNSTSDRLTIIVRSVVLLAILHAVYINRQEHSRHPSLAVVPSIIIAEAELCWSLLSATIPNLKSFMKSFNTGFGHDFGLDTMTGSGLYASGPCSRHTGGGGSGRNDDIQLQGLRKSGTAATSTRDFIQGMHPQGKAYEAEIMGNQPQETSSVSSGKSQEMIIRKDVQVTVDRGHRKRPMF